MLSKATIGTVHARCYTERTMAYSIEAGDFARLEVAWETLLSASPAGHVFYTPQWQQAWWRTFGADSDLNLLSATRNGEVVGIIPLRRHGDRLAFIGSSDVCDYMDFVIGEGHERAALSALLDFLEPLEWTSIDLQSLLPDSIALSHFAPLAREQGYRVETTAEDVSPQLALPAEWEGYFSLLGRKDRHELRRKMRRLSEVEYRFTMSGDWESLHDDLGDFFRLFTLARDDKRCFLTDRMNGFFDAMARSVAPRGYLRLAFLEVGGSRAAAAMCFDCWDHFHLYNSGYDPAYASLSVGLVCKALCIKEGIIEGKRHFDFLRGAEPYKYDLGGRDVPISRCVVARG